MAKPAPKPAVTSQAALIDKPQPAKPAEATSPAPVEKVQKAFTLERVQDGWSLVTLTFQGNKILGVEKSVPDMKALAIEQFKIASFKYWRDAG